MMSRILRCNWVNSKNELYIKYHDEEWGVINHDDKYLFELLVLEIFHSGLSFEIVLNKRENLRRALDDFNYVTISNYNENKILKLKNDKNLIRHKKKIESLIPNSKVFMNIQEEFGSFDKYIWSFVNNQIYETGKTKSTLSDTVTKDLKSRGMKFIGSTVIYSYLQAIGVIVSHDKNCFLYKGEL